MIRSSRTWTVAVTFTVLGLALTACGTSDDDGGVRVSPGLEDPGDCTVIDLSVSSEKVALMNELATAFNRSAQAETEDGCLFARPQNKASGLATTLLATDFYPRGARSARGSG